MEITNGRDKVKLHAWQFILVALLGFAVIGCITYTTISWHKANVEATKVIQEEKSNRGHWIWGHWHDIAAKKDK